LFLLAGVAPASERFIDPAFLLRNWDLDDGLPSTRISAVARTADGYVWLATFNGLARFDGVRFSRFASENTPAFHNNQVASLLVDREGALWVGTYQGGLLKHAGDGFVAVDLPDAEGAAVKALAQDREGTIWIGTSGGALMRFGQGTVRTVGEAEGWSSTNTTKLLCDGAGRLWAVAGQRLLRFEAGRWGWPAEMEPPEHAVQAVAVSADGGLWVATLSGTEADNRGARIRKLKAGRWEPELEPYPWPQDSSRSRVRALYEDREGRLWCGTAGRGVFLRLPDGSWQQLAPEAPLVQLDTLCLAEDEGGVIWIGTRTEGLYQARPRLVRTLHMPDGASESEIVSACVTRDGGVWGGTDGAGLFRWRGNEVRQYGLDQGLGDLRVATLLEDSRSNLWAGTYGGLYRLRGDRFEAAAGSAALRSPTFALLEDRQGRLWAGSIGRLVCVENGHATVHGRDEGLGSGRVRAMAEDADGALWVALDGAGLYRRRGVHFEHQQPRVWADGHPVLRWPGEDCIRAVHFDADGSLWLATSGFGLHRLSEGVLQQWEWGPDGLPSSHQMALLEDRRGNLWLSSENGIFGLSKKALEHYRRGRNPALTPWRLTPDEGLSHKVCSGIGQPTAAQSPDGRMWFPDGIALATFDPEAIPRGVRTWPPLVEETVVDGRPLAPERDGVLRAKSGARSYQIHFSSPNILAPGRLRFRYKMDGLDKDWLEAGSERTAQFNRLAPGRYRFRVEASGPDQAWQPAASPLRVEVMPRFYERTSVQLAAGLALLAAVAGIALASERARSRRRLERLKLQQSMDQERQRIAADIHDELGAGLTEISLLGDGLRRDSQRVTSAEEVARQISTRARALTRSMDEVVWAINPRNDTLESFLTYLNHFAQEYLNRAGVRCRFDLPMELPELPLSSEARHHLYLASKEVLHNIVKHAGATEVWIRLGLDGRGFTLEIEDNGKGFDPAVPPRRGNGLANMRLRLEELRGQCLIDTAPGKGVRVKFAMACGTSRPPGG
jgi:ligand-binding sensor domain-containing protein/signal transduction histidine kinase